MAESKPTKTVVAKTKAVKKTITKTTKPRKTRSLASRLLSSGRVVKMKFALQKEDLVRYALYEAFQKQPIYMAFFAVWGLLMLVVLWTGIPMEPLFFLGVGTLTGGVVLLILGLFVGTFLWSWRAFEHDGFQKIYFKSDWYFDEKEVVYQNKFLESRMKWKLFHRFHLHEDYIFLYPFPGQAFVFPIRHFGSQEQLDDFVGLLLDKIR